MHPFDQGKDVYSLTIKLPVAFKLILEEALENGFADASDFIKYTLRYTYDAHKKFNRKVKAKSAPKKRGRPSKNDLTRRNNRPVQYLNLTEIEYGCQILGGKLHRTVGKNEESDTYSFEFRYLSGTPFFIPLNEINSINTQEPETELDALVKQHKDILDRVWTDSSGKGFTDWQYNTWIDGWGDNTVDIENMDN